VDTNYFLDGNIRLDGGINPPRIKDPYIDLYDPDTPIYRF